MFSAVALSTFITLGGWSTHFDKTYTQGKQEIKYNNEHRALIVEVNGYTGGMFINSYYEPSMVLGYTIRTDHLYATLGLASGYEGHKEACLETIEKACVVLNMGVKYEFISIGLVGEAVVTSLTFEF